MSEYAMLESAPATGVDDERPAGPPSGRGSLVMRLVGDDRRVGLEQRLFNAISLLNGAVNIAGAAVLAWVHARPGVVVLNAAVGALFLAIYAVARLRGIYTPLYWPLLLTIAVFLTSNAILGGGSTGGSYVYFVPALVIATILADRTATAVRAALLFSAAPLVVVAVEQRWPEAIVHYASPEVRLVDVTGNFLFVELFTGALVLLLARSLNAERRRSDALLLNVLPDEVAAELKFEARARPRSYESATVLFTDFVGFTTIAERLTPEELVGELDRCFREFDAIAKRHGLEKIKTIGDSYMAAGGLPVPNATHAIDCVLAALDICRVLERRQREKAEAGEPCWGLRVGIHTGPLVAGVIGREKFAYDVWGDTVNTASRLESSGVAGRVNISAATYDRVAPFFACEPRGHVPAKGKGTLEMYLVTGLRPELSEAGDGLSPNGAFRAMYRALGAA